MIQLYTSNIPQCLSMFDRSSNSSNSWNSHSFSSISSHPRISQNSRFAWFTHICKSRENDLLKEPIQICPLPQSRPIYPRVPIPVPVTVPSGLCLPRSGGASATLPALRPGPGLEDLETRTGAGHWGLAPWLRWLGGYRKSLKSRGG